jgi:hypothetical protein
MKERGDFMKIDGAVYNAISEQYMDVMQITSEPKKRTIKSLFFWVMGILQLNYWENVGEAKIDAELLADEREMFVKIDAGFMHRGYNRSLGGLFSRAEIEEILKMFAEVFNYTDPLVKEHFHADDPKIYGRNNFWTQANGRFIVNIHIDPVEE